MSFATLIEPIALWQRVGRELGQPVRAAQRLALLALLGAFGPACAVYAGSHWVSAITGAEIGMLTLKEGQFDPFRATFLGLLLVPLLQSVMYLLLASIYRLPRQPLTAYAVAVVGLIPVYVAGLTLVFMPAVLLTVGAFFLSCFWWAVGARTLLGVAPGDSAEFNAIAIVGTTVLLQFVGTLLGSLL